MPLKKLSRSPALDPSAGPPQADGTRTNISAFRAKKHLAGSFPQFAKRTHPLQRLQCDEWDPPGGHKLTAQLLNKFPLISLLTAAVRVVVGGIILPLL
ncbi:hypothetical protein JZ751_007044 [Albula glossodonta]|uniref:Uncharacterized protein n=1 Tax=Albula glossodonta TaxID=121402 RepID=A0A8T2P4I9_9TELE|nr:hypothetical protein JZ751_007044 [Albula glossodonta]